VKFDSNERVGDEAVRYPDEGEMNGLNPFLKGKRKGCGAARLVSKNGSTAKSCLVLQDICRLTISKR